MQTLRDIGELSAIERLRKILCETGSGLGPAVAGDEVGQALTTPSEQSFRDDCAVVKMRDNASYDWLLTSDPVIEGTHFDRETPPAAIGHKAIGRVLSDLAAMGGEPDWALVDLVAPPDTPVSRLEKIYKGASLLARNYDLALVGGDLSRGPALELHVFAIGRVPAGSAILRSGARPGDIIYVTGSLGASITGKHLSFEPRVTQGIWLRSESWPNSLIDISDGLARDLRHIANMSRTGAELNTSWIPLSKEALEINDGTSPIDHALYDGEDFELLFTVPSDKEKTFEDSWNETFDLPCTSIGRITDKTGIIECVDENGKRTRLSNNGYRHFKENE